MIENDDDNGDDCSKLVWPTSANRHLNGGFVANEKLIRFSLSRCDYCKCHAGTRFDGKCSHSTQLDRTIGSTEIKLCRWQLISIRLIFIAFFKFNKTRFDLVFFSNSTCVSAPPLLVICFSNQPREQSQAKKKHERKKVIDREIANRKKTWWIFARNECQAMQSGWSDCAPRDSSLFSCPLISLSLSFSVRCAFGPAKRKWSTIDRR